MDVLTSMVDALGLVRAEVLLCLFASGYFLVSVFVSLRGTTWGALSLLLLGLTLVWLPNESASASLSGLFRHDSFAAFGRALSFFLGFGYLLACQGRVADRVAAEFYACVFIVIAGLGLAAAANDLIMLFLALEMVSIPTYILLYLLRNDTPSQEAVTKYFLLSLFAAAMFLYGLSLLFGSVGTTNLEAIRLALAAHLATPDGPPLPTVLLVGLVMLVAGLAFRLTAAPFHFYAPDVYEGAPTVAVTLLAVVPKVAGVVGIYQLVAATLLVPGVSGQFTALAPQAGGLFWIMALISMVVGNLLGLWQDNLKRLLAYSSVAHAGYLLVGMGAGMQTGVMVDGWTATLFYLVVYSVATLGSFALLIALETAERPLNSVDDLAGLGKSHPFLAFLMAVFLFSLTGLPPTAGFLGKLNLFFAAWGTDHRLYQLLALLMALTAAVGAWYYLRLVGVMYLRDAVKPLAPRPQWPAVVVATLCAVLMLWWFVSPQALYQAAQAALPSASAFVK